MLPEEKPSAAAIRAGWQRADRRPGQGGGGRVCRAALIWGWVSETDARLTVGTESG